jgi:hypothetical protein
MSKKDTKKTGQARGRKDSDSDLHDFMEEDQSYDGYSAEQDQPKDKNKKLTEYTATFRPVTFGMSLGKIQDQPTGESTSRRVV